MGRGKLYSEELDWLEKWTEAREAEKQCVPQLLTFVHLPIMDPSRQSVLEDPTVLPQGLGSLPQ